MENSIKKRICLYDNLKFLLIIFVVVGHFADIFTAKSSFCKSVFIFIYAFHMPLFIFISGQFNKNEKVLNRILKYLAIGFSLKLILALCPLILDGSIPSFKLLSDSGIPWFMFALAAFTGISNILKDVDKKYVLISAVVLACFVGYDASVGDYLYLSRIIVFYPFYVLGEIINKDKIVEMSKNNWIKIIALMIIIIWAIVSFKFLNIVYFLRPLFTGRNPFNTNNVFLKLGPLYRILCYLLSCIIGCSFISIVPNKKITLITKFRRKNIAGIFLALASCQATNEI